jgi:adenylate cyclase
MCCEAQPLGGAEVDTGVLFADMRGFTALAEQRTPEEVARLLNRFYCLAADVLVAHYALIDKLMGDEVMALFLPGFAGKEYVSKMVSAAETLLKRIGYGSREGPWIPIGIGLDRGLAFVGNVGSSEVADFTAIGDVVNTAARLQGEAGPGQIIMSERVYEDVSGHYPDAPSVQLELKGKSAPVAARLVNIASGPRTRP